MFVMLLFIPTLRVRGDTISHFYLRVKIGLMRLHRTSQKSVMLSRTYCLASIVLVSPLFDLYADHEAANSFNRNST